MYIVMLVHDANFCLTHYASKVSGLATVEEPPTFPFFKIGHATKNNPASTPQPSFPPPYPYPYPMYPPPYTPYTTPSSCQHGSHASPAHVNTSATQPTPSLEEFFQEVDREYGKSGEYMQFLQNFENEALCVPHIKYLTAEQFQKMGVTRIGWQIALKKVAEKYK
jgi:hypothetical protein